MQNKWYVLLVTNWLLRDGENTQKKDIDVQIKSGEYFVTLATELDQISWEVDLKGARQLQDLVDELLYIQRRYKITEKQS